MDIVIDIETIPGDLSKRDRDLAELAETAHLTCSLTKSAIIEQLGDPQLKYKTLDELKPMWIEANKAQAVEEMYKKRSFDGGYGQVCSVALSRVDQDDVKSMSLDNAENELDILFWLCDTLEDFCRRKDDGFTKPIFVGHNITFDLKFLYRRMVINEANPVVSFPFGGWHGKDYFCTMQAWCGKDGKDRISQDNLCKVLGIEGKPGHIDGSLVYDYALKGDYKIIEEYNVDDVVKCKQIYKRLKQ